MSRNFVLVAIAATLLAPSAFAQSSLAAINSSLRLSAGIHHLDYCEHDDSRLTSDGILDTEKGAQAQPGVALGWQFAGGPLKNVFTEVDARRARGTTSYRGYLQTSHSPDLIPYAFDGTRVLTTETTAKLGYAVGLGGGREQLTPYLAYSTYRWKRDTSASAFGYREDYRHDAVAVGVKYQTALNRALAFEFDGAVGRTRQASMRLSALGATFGLGASTMSSARLGLVQRLSTHFDMRYGLEVVRFGYGQSAVDGGILEPRSTSVISSATVGVGYRF